MTEREKKTMQECISELRDLPKDKFIHILCLIKEANALNKENKQLKENIKRAFDYIENQRIRELSIVDVNALTGILNEGMTIDE